ncbi:hypothetical protein [Ensifer sp. CCNWLY38]|uniref:hypothetical protein n=1 Tax=Ensifer sp. CCNWLY38 TaxID=3125792 RepID=UPI003014FB43
MSGGPFEGAHGTHGRNLAHGPEISILYVSMREIALREAAKILTFFANTTAKTKRIAMLSAVRSTILHALNWAGNALNPTIAIDTFSEFQLKDIGLTRDQETIRARVGDIADPWHWPKEDNPRKSPPSPERDCGDAPQMARASPRAQPGENKDVSMSLCD